MPAKSSSLSEMTDKEIKLDFIMDYLGKNNRFQCQSNCLQSIIMDYNEVFCFKNNRL